MIPAIRHSKPVTLLTWASPAESQLVKRESNAAELMIYSFSFTHSDISTRSWLMTATRQTKFCASVMRCWSNLTHMIAKWIQIEINDTFIEWTAVLTFSKSDCGESRRWQNVVFFIHSQKCIYRERKTATDIATLYDRPHVIYSLPIYLLVKCYFAICMFFHILLFILSFLNN